MPQEKIFTPNLTGKDYTTPDVRAKVTGTARYANDFRKEGMLFCKLLTSPMPHAKVTHLDTTQALAMPGVRAILTADELPPPAASVTDTGQMVEANPWAERGLTMEPLFKGDPILAVAAVDEETAAAAIEAINIRLEPLPFVINPLDSLRPDGPNARTDGNAWVGGNGGEIKWSKADFDSAKPGELPWGNGGNEWTYGDLDAGFKNSALVLDKTFVTPNVSHEALETRSAMSWWENGKLFLCTGTQSTAQTVKAIARWMDMKPEEIVFISEYTGGGFGGKITASVILIVSALLSKKANAPVVMRITRQEEQYVGRARASCLGRMRAGFSKAGRLQALDLLVVEDNGPYEMQYDALMLGRMASLLYQPEAMRWRGVTILTNTPTRASQTAPGGLQNAAFMGVLLTKAARQLNIDPLQIFKINAPKGRAPLGPANKDGIRSVVTSAFVKQALDQGAEAFGWQARRAAAASRKAQNIRRGVGVATGCFVAGSSGFDGLFVITPKGEIRIHSGVGNLGNESFSDVNRVVADALGVPWEKCKIVWGNSGKHLPWTCTQGGSKTIHTMTRAALAASLDAKKKLKQIAADILGGRPEDFIVGNEQVMSKEKGQGMSFAQAARRAIEMGGIYDGHEFPDDINEMTKRSVSALAGQGLVAVARDNFQHDGQTHSYVATFAEVEVDIETGQYRIINFHVQADAGIVVHPRAFGGQLVGRSMLGIGHVTGQKWFYDKQYGLPVSVRFYQTRPPSILDLPEKFSWGAVGIPDPQTPVGARGVCEPATCGGCAAVLCALADALGDNAFARAPVMTDAVLSALYPEVEDHTTRLCANV
jgi:CO/xanthine dehydrogenase Mo-binding subunit